MRTGFDATTGAVLTGWAHCAQSIHRILTTRVGTCVLARDFGSEAPELQDAPQNAATIIRHFVAIATALRRWEPGYRLNKVTPTQLGADGVVAFALAGDFYPNGHIGDYSIVERGLTLAWPS